MDNVSLYVSKFSEASKRAVELCHRLGLSEFINIVGIDNPEIREYIRFGKLFTITVVPTLVVDNGNIKLYQGHKAIQYMQAVAEERYRQSQALIQQQQPMPTIMKKHQSKMLNQLDDEDYDEIEDLQDEVNEAQSILGGGDSNGVIQKGKVENLNTIMSQMQARRSEELGYNEKELPQF